MQEAALTAMAQHLGIEEMLAAQSISKFSKASHINWVKTYRIQETKDHYKRL